MNIFHSNNRVVSSHTAKAKLCSIKPLKTNAHILIYILMNIAAFAVLRFIASRGHYYVDLSAGCCLYLR